MEGRETQLAEVTLKKLEDTDQLLNTVEALERTRHRTRLFSAVAGIGVPTLIGVRAAFTGDPSFLLHALVVTLFVVGAAWYTGRKYDRIIEGLDEELRRISGPDTDHRTLSSPPSSPSPSDEQLDALPQAEETWSGTG